MVERGVQDRELIGRYARVSSRPSEDEAVMVGDEEEERNHDEEETNQLIDDVTADRLRVSSIFNGE